jgi:hypothetical protein
VPRSPPQNKVTLADQGGGNPTNFIRVFDEHICQDLELSAKGLKWISLIKMRIGHIAFFVNIIRLPKDFDFQENRSASSQALEDDRRGSEATAEPVLEDVVSQQNIVVAVNTTPAKPRRPDYREVRNRINVVHFSVFPGIFWS